jgi:predicted RNA binding protein YcfA (HicA-like mRNA interferase family)
MKTSEFERILADSGFALVRISGHRIWGNGTQQIAVPHSRMINRLVARRLLKSINYAGRVEALNYG